MSSSVALVIIPVAICIHICQSVALYVFLRCGEIEKFITATFDDIAGYRYFRTETPLLLDETCTLLRPAVLPYIECITIRARAANRRYVQST